MMVKFILFAVLALTALPTVTEACCGRMAARIHARREARAARWHAAACHAAPAASHCGCACANCNCR